MFSFHRGSSTDLNKEDRREAIRLLTQLREFGFPAVEIKKIYESKSTKKNIVNLCLEIGSKLIKNELEKEGKGKNFLEEKKHFYSILKDMERSENILPFLNYAAELLQFYTFSCQESLERKKGIINLNNFIASKKKILGDCKGNLLVIEYKIITSYNELVELQDDFEKNNIPKEESNSKLVGILYEIGKMKDEIEDKIRKSPNNPFCFYIKFALNYCCAKAVEFQYQIGENSFNEQEKIAMSELQKLFFTEAKNSLDTLKEEKRFVKINSNELHIFRNAFSIGREMLRKLPSANLETITEHLIALSK